VIFDKEASRLFTRIIGIAPIAKQVIGNTGKSVSTFIVLDLLSRSAQNTCKTDVYNPKNFSSRMTWEELFESRYFTSYIIKSSANNPTDNTSMQ
jgi:hypothetical protein